jgi:hypothetical protein
MKTKLSMKDMRNMVKFADADSAVWSFNLEDGTTVAVGEIRKLLAKIDLTTALDAEHDEATLEDAIRSEIGTFGGF